MMLAWGQPPWEWPAELDMGTQSSNSGLSQSQGVGRWVCRLPFPHKLLLLSLSLQTLTGSPVSYKQGCVTLAKWLYLSEPQFVHLEKWVEAMCPTCTVAST